jgi:hypothetical protein
MEIITLSKTGEVVFSGKYSNPSNVPMSNVDFLENDSTDFD